MGKQTCTTRGMVAEDAFTTFYLRGFLLAEVQNLVSSTMWKTALAIGARLYLSGKIPAIQIM